MVVKFRNPPLAEVIFSIEFEGTNFSSVHPGLYWQTIRDRFPFQSDQTPFLRELIDLQMPPIRKTFFYSSDKTKLIQLQDGFFAFNFRIEANNQYPHFEQIFDYFLNEWSHLINWWSQYDASSIKPIKCELIYNNLIDEDSGWSSAEDHGKVFTFIRTSWKDFFSIPDFLDSRILLSLPEDKGIVVIDIDQRIEEADDNDVINEFDDSIDVNSFLIFRLLAKSSDNVTDLHEWFKLAHEYIIKSFLFLTTDEAQVRWGRYVD